MGLAGGTGPTPSAERLSPKSGAFVRSRAQGRGRCVWTSTRDWIPEPLSSGRFLVVLGEKGREGRGPQSRGRGQGLGGFCGVVRRGNKVSPVRRRRPGDLPPCDYVRYVRRNRPGPRPSVVPAAPHHVRPTLSLAGRRFADRARWGGLGTGP